MNRIQTSPPLRRPRAAAGLLLLAALGILAWAGARALPTIPPPAPPRPALSQPALALPGPALGAPLRKKLEALPHLWGRPATAFDLRGRVVVVTFFASWCPPCRRELEHLRKIQRAHAGRGLEVVAINLFENFDGFSDRAKLTAFLEQTGYPFPVIEGDAEISRAFGTVRRIPSLFVFDRRGRPVLVFANQRGPGRDQLGFESLLATVEPLLQAVDPFAPRRPVVPPVFPLPSASGIL
ncbi:MAG: TlpA disulfide reductase family protein [bacterium]